MISDQYERLVALVEKDNSPCLSVQDVSDYLGKDVNTIRLMAMRGEIPFAIGGKTHDGGKRIVVIPKLAFWAWITKP